MVFFFFLSENHAIFEFVTYYNTSSHTHIHTQRNSIMFKSSKEFEDIYRVRICPEKNIYFHLFIFLRCSCVHALKKKKKLFLYEHIV